MALEAIPTGAKDFTDELASEARPGSSWLWQGDRRSRALSRRCVLSLAVRPESRPSLADDAGEVTTVNGGLKSPSAPLRQVNRMQPAHAWMDSHSRSSGCRPVESFEVFVTPNLKVIAWPMSVLSSTTSTLPAGREAR